MVELVSDLEYVKDFSLISDELNKSCQNVYDLRNVFEDVSGKIYSDKGHTSNFGNQIVAEKLFQISLPIIKSTFNSQN